MTRRRRAAKKPPRTSPKPIVPEPLRDTAHLSEKLTYQVRKITTGPVKTIRPDGSVRSKRKSRSQLTDEGWAEHVGKHPRNELGRPGLGRPGQRLGARARQRLLKDEQNIKVDLKTILGRLKS
jgi:hypothetical protein